MGEYLRSRSLGATPVASKTYNELRSLLARARARGGEGLSGDPLESIASAAQAAVAPVTVPIVQPATPSTLQQLAQAFQAQQAAAKKLKPLPWVTKGTPAYAPPSFLQKIAGEMRLHPLYVVLGVGGIAVAVVLLRRKRGRS